MDEPYDPDPLGLGIAVFYSCVQCARDRACDCVAAMRDGTLGYAHPNVVEIDGRPCVCGAGLITMIYADNINRGGEDDL